MTTAVPAVSFSFAGTPGIAIGVMAALALLVMILVYSSTTVRRRQARVVEQLQHSTLHVTTIVDAAMDAIVTMDEEGRITTFNPEAERMFGWEADEVHGRLVSETLIPERFRLDHEKGLSHWRRTGEGPALGRLRELVALRRDGSEVPVDLSISLGVREGDRATFVGFIRDVSQRQKAERIQGVRFVVAGVLSEARTLVEASRGVLTAVGTRLQIPFATMWSPTLGGLGSDHQWASDAERVSVLMRTTQGTTVAVGNGLPGRVWSTGRALTLADVESSHEDFERVRAAREAGLTQAIAVPVSSGGKVLAVLEVFTATPLDDETLRTIDDIAGQLGQFLARRRAEMLQDSPERLALLLENASEAVVTVAEDGAITGLNNRARRLFGYSTLEVMGEDLRVLIAEGYREQVIEYVTEVLHAPQGPAMRFVDLVARRKDGTGVDVGVHITPLVVGARQTFLVLVTESPVTTRQLGEGPTELRVYPGRDEEQRPRLA